MAPSDVCCFCTELAWGLGKTLPSGGFCWKWRGSGKAPLEFLVLRDFGKALVLVQRPEPRVVSEGGGEGRW